MNDVLIRVSGACGRITLNRPHAINAVTLPMVNVIHQALTSWARDPAIQFVLVDGAGERGLCAGGDIRALYNAAVSGSLDAAIEFFRHEYQLTYRIARYPKPYVVLMDGVVMGGGIGISSHGSHRIVTERSQLAMPETAIGFIPDVGGTYLLGTAPNEFGTYLSLTGHRIGASDAIACGLADITVPSAKLPSLTRDLEACNSTAALADCLHTYASPQSSPEQRTWIKQSFAAHTVEEIFTALAAHPAAEAQATLADLRKRSPTSLKVTLAALRNGTRFNELAPCLQQEYRIAKTCLREHDFIEGIRAAIIDKDRNPRWQPARLEDVTPEAVQQYFAISNTDDLNLTS
jgi:enoyl-CoA hydratase